MADRSLLRAVCLFTPAVLFAACAVGVELGEDQGNLGTGGAGGATTGGTGGVAPGGTGGVPTTGGTGGVPTTGGTGGVPTTGGTGGVPTTGGTGGVPTTGGTGGVPTTGGTGGGATGGAAGATGGAGGAGGATGGAGGASGGAGGMAGGPTGTGPCAGLCDDPVVFTTGNFQSGNLGSGATCHETTANVGTIGCSSFSDSTRVFSVNGEELACDGQFPAPAKVNNGYCIQVTAGQPEFVSFYTF